MVTKEAVVKSESGLHNRAAALFIQKANEHKCGLWIEIDNRRVNAKSLLGVLSLGLTKGSVVTLIAEGPDEEEALEALTEQLAVAVVV